MSSSRAGSAHGSRPPSQKSSEVSSLNYDPAYTQPSELGEPFRSHLKDKNILKKIKAAGSEIKNARIKGREHPSSSAPQQGQVVSIQLFNSAWKKVVETVHILAGGSVETNKNFRKSNKPVKK